MTLNPRVAWLLRVILVLIPMLALLPFGRLMADWVAFVRIVEVPLPQLPPRGFDWVRWQDRDGEIEAVLSIRAERPTRKAFARGLRCFSLTSSNTLVQTM